MMKDFSTKPSSEKKKKALIIACLGLICLALDFAASWYAVTYNDSRLVVHDFWKMREKRS